MFLDHGNLCTGFVEKKKSNTVRNETKSKGKSERMRSKVCLTSYIFHTFCKVLATHMGTGAHYTFFVEEDCEKKLSPAQQAFSKHQQNLKHPRIIYRD